MLPDTDVPPAPPNPASEAGLASSSLPASFLMSAVALHPSATISFRWADRSGRRPMPSPPAASAPVSSPESSPWSPRHRSPAAVGVPGLSIFIVFCAPSPRPALRSPASSQVGDLRHLETYCDERGDIEVNGRPVDEDVPVPGRHARPRSPSTSSCPTGTLWVMGDHRERLPRLPRPPGRSPAAAWCPSTG